MSLSLVAHEEAPSCEHWLPNNFRATRQPFGLQKVDGPQPLAADHGERLCVWSEKEDVASRLTANGG